MIFQFIPPFFPYVEDSIDVINYNSPLVCPPGPPGPPGPEGPPGPTGSNNSILICEDYTVTDQDYYIGVQTSKPIEILLPENPEQGTSLVIKLEMGPPIGNRKAKIISQSTIDGNSSVTLKTPYESIAIIYRGTKWHII